MNLLPGSTVLVLIDFPSIIDYWTLFNLDVFHFTFLTSKPIIQRLGTKVIIQPLFLETSHITRTLLDSSSISHPLLKQIDARIKFPMSPTHVLSTHLCQAEQKSFKRFEGCGMRANVT